ncbi:ATP-binding protein [Streptomyces scopuliridis]|uniref:ATP-binding protein n=1 Tax=Streptomyces scopuliridis TaxID=452529 RepID=A0ACD4ZK87_9ACTN|nr:ATP-binding protein [Streptomyces scopuliridis]WSB34656.1 ATP-binding protein [Streptomyces scopuliridis]WSB98904.1 ATP-binding protein [Streptomyces scopuliridis]WSC07394.1 ATP-binding protein [Streptomyces scopuliridis]
MTTVTATATPVPPPPQGAETYRLALPSTATAPRIARDFVTSLLGLSRHRNLVDDARLCVTEVVTNAHRHTRTPLIRVRVTVNRKQVTVSVSDDKPWALPTPVTPTARTAPGAVRAGGEQDSGRGLVLVESLALAWGSTIYGGCSPSHKTVWFTLSEASNEVAGRWNP